MDFAKKMFGFKNPFSGGPALAAACGSDQGKRRKNNEDNLYFKGFRMPEGTDGPEDYMPSDNHGSEVIVEKEYALSQDSFFCVFDGMGGGDFGEVASYTAAKTAKEYLSVEQHINPCDITPSLTEMCNAINQSVYQAGMNLGSDQTGSTLVGLYFHAGQVWICNLGDSRGYLLRDGKLLQISLDHTDAAFMQENGITGRKPYLTQYLGIDPDEMMIEPYIRSYYLREGDTFLICSDGVTDMVGEQEICRILAHNEDVGDCVDLLIQAALDGGGKDNITAIVVRME
ncbi:MAG: protein phosphatase 2C domain-containing protein [Lachnospiraceae bacterium]|nr:protein phosphatase 2C domain-containing protein [Lachnospiraceae bacterium]